MKKIILITITIFFITVMGYGQKKSKNEISKSKVPVEVIKSFKKMYPEAKVVEWYFYADYWHFEGDTVLFFTKCYGVEYRIESKEQISVFTRYGDWVHTNRPIIEGELPKVVSDSLNNSEYKDWELIGEREKMYKVKTKEPLYKIEVEKGKKRHILYFDSNGKIVQRKRIVL